MYVEPFSISLYWKEPSVTFCVKSVGLYGGSLPYSVIEKGSTYIPGMYVEPFSIALYGKEPSVTFCVKNLSVILFMMAFQWEAPVNHGLTRTPSKIDKGRVESSGNVSRPHQRCGICTVQKLGQMASCRLLYFQFTTKLLFKSLSVQKSNKGLTIQSPGGGGGCHFVPFRTWFISK